MIVSLDLLIFKLAISSSKGILDGSGLFNFSFVSDCEKTGLLSCALVSVMTIFALTTVIAFKRNVFPNIANQSRLKLASSNVIFGTSFPDIDTSLVVTARVGKNDQLRSPSITKLIWFSLASLEICGL